jgi:hypothetical protein
MDPKILDGMAACVYVAAGKNKWLAVVHDNEPYGSIKCTEFID